MSTDNDTYAAQRCSHGRTVNEECPACRDDEAADLFPRDAYLGSVEVYAHPIRLEEWCVGCGHHATAHWDDDEAQCSLCQCDNFDPADQDL